VDNASASAWPGVRSARHHSIILFLALETRLHPRERRGWVVDRWVPPGRVDAALVERQLPGPIGGAELVPEGNIRVQAVGENPAVLTDILTSIMSVVSAPWGRWA
jgi:hypothetical protein